MLHDYSPDEGDEEYLTLRKGEIICRVIEVDEMYLFGELRSHTGLFPSNCVQIIGKWQLISFHCQETGTSYRWFVILSYIHFGWGPLHILRRFSLNWAKAF